MPRAIPTVQCILGLWRTDPSLEPARSEPDEVWVIVGDVPPAYIATKHRITAAGALIGYVEEMLRWIEAVEHGMPIDSLIPVLRRHSLVPVGGDRELAKALSGRLDFIIHEILAAHFPAELRAAGYDL